MGKIHEATLSSLVGASHCVVTAWSIRDGAKRGSQKGVGFVGAYAFFSHCDYTPAMGAGAWKMLRKRAPGVSEQHARRILCPLLSILYF